MLSPAGAPAVCQGSLGASSGAGPDVPSACQTPWGPSPPAPAPWPWPLGVGTLSVRQSSLGAVSRGAAAGGGVPPACQGSLSPRPWPVQGPPSCRASSASSAPRREGLPGFGAQGYAFLQDAEWHGRCIEGYEYEEVARVRGSGDECFCQMQNGTAGVAVPEGTCEVAMM